MTIAKAHKPPHSSDDEDSSYYCPIHPEILKEKPGACTQCGMPLVEATG